MKDIGIRSLSGAGYVGVLLGAIYTADWAFVIVIALFSGLALWEFSRLCKASPWISMAFLLLCFGLGYFRMMPALIRDLLLVLSLLNNSYLCYLLFSQKSMDISPKKGLYFALTYVMASSYFIPEIERFDAESGVGLLLLFYVATWANNSFAYLVGSAIGKNKLFPTISPKKSWEGFIGGTLATLLIAYIFSFYSNIDIFLALVIGLSIPVLATVGDLVQSYFKRKANVKDSGSLLPGHGGFYDRMDSVIFSAPFYYFILILFNYVS